MIKELVEKYAALCENDDPAGCGDLVIGLDDSTCKELFDLLSKDSRTKNKMVRALWYNYETQKMRWE